jgi:hypothetical protein
MQFPELADALAKWLPPNGFTGKVHHLDAEVGGSYKMSFTNFTTGERPFFGRTYHELTPDERIHYTTKPTIRTCLITQEGASAAIPAEACYLGWQESLTLLPQLVEAEIPASHETVPFDRPDFGRSPILIPTTPPTRSAGRRA